MIEEWKNMVDKKIMRIGIPIAFTIYSVLGGFYALEGYRLRNNHSFLLEEKPFYPSSWLFSEKINIPTKIYTDPEDLRSSYIDIEPFGTLDLVRHLSLGVNIDRSPGHRDQVRFEELEKMVKK